MRSAIVPAVFAIILLAAGFYAYSAAPETANRTTALIVPGACAGVMLLIALIVAVAPHHRFRRITHIVGTVLTLVFGAAFTSRAIPAMSASRAHELASQDLERQIEAGVIEDTPEARAAFYEAEDVPDHSKMYLGATLFVLTGVSALAFVGMIATHPRQPGQLPPIDGESLSETA